MIIRKMLNTELKYSIYYIKRLKKQKKKSFVFVYSIFKHLTRSLNIFIKFSLSTRALSKRAINGIE